MRRRRWEMVWAIDDQSMRLLIHKYLGDTTRLNALRSVAVVVVSGRKTYRFEPPSVEKSVFTESDRLISPAGTYRGREEESPGGLHPKNTGGIHGGRRSDESEQDLEGGKWDEDEDEEREVRSTQAAFQGRGRPVSGSGVLGKCPSLSGCSLDRPRSYPDSSQLPITQRRLFALSYPPLLHDPPLATFCLCSSLGATHFQNGCHSGSRPRRARRDQALQVRDW